MVFSSQETEGFSYGERTSIIWTYARLVLFVVSIVLMATSLLFAIIWVLRKVFGGMKDVKHLAVRAIPLLATLAFCGLVFCFTNWPRQAQTRENSRFGPPEFSLSASYFRFFRSIGLFLVVRVPKTEIHAGTRIHSLLVALACCIVTVFIASWHVIGLRLWTP